MGKTTGIAWCDHTFNPWWVCQMVSNACAKCYAMTWAARWGWAWGHGAPRRTWPHDARHWEEPRAWHRAAGRDGVRRRCFTASMADILDAATDPRDPASLGPDDPPFWELDVERAALWTLMDATTNLDWLALSKRPEHWLRMVPAPWLTAWPQHVWVGATTENAEQAALRWVWLIHLVERCAVRPPVLFASMEPLVGPIDWTALPPLTIARAAQLYRGLYPTDEALALATRWRALWDQYVVRYGDGQTLNVLQHGLLDWGITGGESDSDGSARPWHPGWVRQLRDQLTAHGVAFFHKQHGEWSPTPPPTGGRQPRGAAPIRAHTFPATAAFDAATVWYLGKRVTGNRLDEQVWQHFPPSRMPAPVAVPRPRTHPPVVKRQDQRG